jgi:hypothetical protein
MTSVERMQRLTKATGKAPSKRRRPSAGDGDVCPLDASHGAMLVMRMAPGGLTEPRQYCPHVGHQPMGGPHERISWPFDVEPGDLDRLATSEWNRLAGLAVAS